MFSDVSVEPRRGPLQRYLYPFLARFYVVLIAVAAFLLDWAGVNWSRYHHGPIIGPARPLSAVWWHLPFYLAIGAAQDWFRRSRPPKPPPDEDDDGDKAITLNLSSEKGQGK